MKDYLKVQFVFTVHNTVSIQYLYKTQLSLYGYNNNICLQKYEKKFPPHIFYPFS